MIAITFALPEESGDFLGRVKVFRRVGKGVGSSVEGEFEGRPVLVWHVGVGEERARVEISRLLAHAQPAWLLCAGYAGALQAELEIADVVLDWRGRIPFATPTSNWRLGSIVSASAAAETVASKERLAALGAVAVDMETAVIEQACAAASVPLVALRSISDRADDPLPVPMAHWFDLQTQGPRPAALLRFLARHPARIVPFFRFVRGLAPARGALANALTTLIRAIPA